MREEDTNGGLMALNTDPNGAEECLIIMKAQRGIARNYGPSVLKMTLMTSLLKSSICGKVLHLTTFTHSMAVFTHTHKFHQSAVVLLLQAVFHLQSVTGGSSWFHLKIESNVLHRSICCIMFLTRFYLRQIETERAALPFPCDAAEC